MNHDCEDLDHDYSREEESWMDKESKHERQKVENPVWRFIKKVAESDPALWGMVAIITIIICAVCNVAPKVALYIETCEETSYHSEYSSEQDREVSSGQSTDQAESIPFNLEKIAEDPGRVVEYSFCLYRDTVTDVLFIVEESGGVEMMQDPETGLPLTYARYMELAAGNQPD